MSAPVLEKRLERFSRAAEGIRRELAKAVVGQEDVVEQLLIALFALGHCLLVGVPGFVKTLFVSFLASIRGLQF